MNRIQLTNKRVNEFLKDSSIAPRQKLYDKEIPRLYVQKLKTGGFFYLSYISPTNFKARVYPICRFADKGKTCEQARLKAKKLIGRITDGEDPLGSKQQAREMMAKTGRDYLERFYKAVQENKNSGPATIQLIEKNFAKLLDKPIANLKKADVDRWQATIRKKGLKYSSLKRRYTAFKTMLNKAVKDEYIDHNPLQPVKLEKYQESEDERSLRKARRGYLETSQMHDFLKALDSYQEEKRQQRRNSRAHGKPHLPDLDKVEFVDHVKPLMLLLFYTGFRNGDAIGLRWEHVNLNFRQISKTIEKTAHKIDKIQHFPIPDPLLDALKRWHSQNGKPLTGLVFPSPRSGKRLERTALKKPWKKIKELAGLPDELQLYTLRHNFASHLVMEGCDLLSVAKLMGHKDVEMIVEHYGHLRRGLLQDYSARFADITKPSDSKPQAQEISA
jgi:integrase